MRTPAFPVGSIPSILSGSVPALCCFLLLLTATTPHRAALADEVSRSPTRWAVVVVGLPGDDEHAAAFPRTALQWKNSLTTRLAVPPEQILLFSAVPLDAQPVGPPATADSLREQFQTLATRLRPDDSFWLFLLGHANYDGQATFLHLPGRDPDAATLASWLEPLPCREQVVWLTNSCSGWFVQRLARPGRVVVSATAAAGEDNATEFPYALGDALELPLDRLDRNHDARLSVLELFLAAAAAAEARFQADKRVPTETAQLDDNGDGQATAWTVLAKQAGSAAPTPRPQEQPSAIPRRDGELAASMEIVLAPAGESP